MIKPVFSNILLPGSATLLLAFTLMLSGCNTIEGIGEDIEETGERIEDSAK